MAGKADLGEVFGFPPANLSPQAVYTRRNLLCPFNNKGPRCTKDSVTDPLGVCSVRNDTAVTITCPVRFRQDWLISVNAAAFSFRAIRFGAQFPKYACPTKTVNLPVILTW